MMMQLFLLTITLLGWLVIISLGIAVGLALKWTHEGWAERRDWDIWTEQAIQVTKEK